MKYLIIPIITICLFSCSNENPFSVKFPAADNSTIAINSEVLKNLDTLSDFSMFKKFDYILSKDGDYYEGFNFTLYPLAKVNETHLVLLKKVHLFDGGLILPFYLECEKSGIIKKVDSLFSYEINANCEYLPRITIDENGLNNTSYNYCIGYDQEREENYESRDTIEMDYKL